MKERREGKERRNACNHSVPLEALYSLTLVGSGTPPSLSQTSFTKSHIQMARSAAMDEVSDAGAFTRTASIFHNPISRDPNSQFLAESGRYHLQTHMGKNQEG
ncbi:uncharacterized protein LOC132799465 isoform X2 [Ziziphus jujuba]|uniref:Uncharacterized protein LOC132799465 isoform X2 n=1 Tax=Ziziphus jujuba TaxID=326968 RepID=A0ABM3ZS37_ZIZJJ|nr:uncharacterized protein LOC132799465 isoform X2 [Ziziphus jujuba]